MQSKATTPQQYLDELPEDRKEPIEKIGLVILDNLPEGVEEQMSYGILGYVIPHTMYPGGYHCNADLQLPFMNLVSQKNFVAVYSMVLYVKKELIGQLTAKISAEECIEIYESVVKK
jgi:hypothetical protein